MNNYVSLTEDQQRLLLSQTAALVGLPEQAVEKDECAEKVPCIN